MGISRQLVACRRARKRVSEPGASEFGPFIAAQGVRLPQGAACGLLVSSGVCGTGSSRPRRCPDLSTSLHLIRDLPSCAAIEGPHCSAAAAR